MNIKLKVNKSEPSTIHVCINALAIRINTWTKIDKPSEYSNAIYPSNRPNRKTWKQGIYKEQKIPLNTVITTSVKIFPYLAKR